MVVYHGLADATPTSGVLDAIADADLVVLAPSNPVSSLAPILRLAGVEDAVAQAATVVAVTPVVSGVPPGDEGQIRRARSRAAQLTSWGLEHRASAVAGLYAGLADCFVLDEADADEGPEIEALGLSVVLTPTLVTSEKAGDSLAAAVLGSIS